ncbi:hypothetical protein BGZ65_010958, partial [Modicella reniformis]
LYQIMEPSVIGSYDFPSDNKESFYEVNWIYAANGRDLLDAEFPSLISAKAECFLTRLTRGAHIIDETNISTLKTIPSKKDIGDAYKIIDDAKTKPGFRAKDLDISWVSMKNFGVVSVPGVRVLKRVHTVMEDSWNIRSLLAWLKEEDDADEITEWNNLRDFINDTPGIKFYAFSPHKKVNIYFNDLLALKHEEWISGQVVDAVFDMFSIQYHHVGYYLLSFRTFFTGCWRYGTSKKTNFGLGGRIEYRNWQWEPMESGTPRHSRWWISVVTGALCIDFTNAVILFGDSMDNGRRARLSDDLQDCIKRWIRSCDVNMEWGNGVERFYVPQQPRGLSGSCGIVALNAIEHSIDSSVERWTHTKSGFHRRRYLAILTRPLKGSETAERNEEQKEEEGGRYVEQEEEERRDEGEGMPQEEEEQEGMDQQTSTYQEASVENKNDSLSSGQFPWKLGERFESRIAAKDAISHWSREVGFNVRFDSKRQYKTT